MHIVTILMALTSSLNWKCIGTGGGGVTGICRPFPEKFSCLDVCFASPIQSIHENQQLIFQNIKNCQSLDCNPSNKSYFFTSTDTLWEQRWPWVYARQSTPSNVRITQRSPNGHGRWGVEYGHECQSRGGRSESGKSRSELGSLLQDWNITLCTAFNLVVTSKLNRRLTGGSVRFWAVVIVKNKSNRPVSDGTAGWVLKSSFNTCNFLGRFGKSASTSNEGSVVWMVGASIPNLGYILLKGFAHYM